MKKMRVEKKNPKFHHSFSLYLEKEPLKISPTFVGGTCGAKAATGGCGEVILTAPSINMSLILIENFPQKSFYSKKQFWW